MTSPFDGVEIHYDKYLPKGQAYLINSRHLHMWRPLSKRTWWKPWTWKRHPMTIVEMWRP